MALRKVRYYGPDYPNIKHGHIYRVKCLHSHGFFLLDDNDDEVYVYAGNCVVID